MNARVASAGNLRFVVRREVTFRYIETGLQKGFWSNPWPICEK
jgi:hypothetical protein